MKFATWIVVLTTASMLTACATGGGDSLISNPLANEKTDWSPTVDMTGVDSAKYETDLADCRTVADNSKAANKSDSVKKSALTGGALGAGAVVGLTVMTGGLALLPLAAGAAMTAGAGGAAAGMVKGSAAANSAYKQTVNGCLSGKGYKVSG